MSWFVRISRQTFWSCAIVAVASLAPSAGLVTLTVPDEPYGAAVGIPDVPHIGKRATDDSPLFSLGADAATYEIIPRLYVEGNIVLDSQSARIAIAPLITQIRAPPIS